MFNYILFFITSVLGATKNYMKYKQFNIILFLRTPFVCTIIYNLIKFMIVNKSILFLSTLILERWIMFIYKIIYSFIDDSYGKKKNKYIVKLQL